MVQRYALRVSEGVAAMNGCPDAAPAIRLRHGHHNRDGPSGLADAWRAGNGVPADSTRGQAANARVAHRLVSQRAVQLAAPHSAGVAHGPVRSRSGDRAAHSALRLAIPLALAVSIPAAPAFAGAPTLLKGAAQIIVTGTFAIG